MIRLAFANSKFIKRILAKLWHKLNEIRKLAVFSLFQLSINQANSDFVTFQIAKCVTAIHRNPPIFNPLE